MIVLGDGFKVSKLTSQGTKSELIDETAYTNISVYYIKVIFKSSFAFLDMQILTFAIQS